MSLRELRLSGVFDPSLTHVVPSVNTHLCPWIEVILEPTQCPLSPLVLPQCPCPFDHCYHVGKVA